MESRNKWQSGSHPLPHDKCDFQCHLIAQKCTAKRSAFRKRQNDSGDIGDSRGDALFLYWCMKEEMEVGWDKEVKREGVFIDTAANFLLASSDKNGWFLLRALALYLPSHISLLTEEGHLCVAVLLFWGELSVSFKCGKEDGRLHLKSFFCSV